MTVARNRRLPDRKPVHRPAQIIDADNYVTECRVIDISSTGAKIRIMHHDGVFPQRFRLSMAQGREMHEVELVWRDGNDAGVRFIAADEKIAASPAAAAPPVAKPLSIMELRRLVAAR